MTDYETIMERLHEYFHEHGMAKSMDYSYGFFDAVAVLKLLKEEGRLK
jgi:hypothetical protein